MVQYYNLYSFHPCAFYCSCTNQYVLLLTELVTEMLPIMWYY